MEWRNQNILFIFSREVLDEERLSMSRILVRINRGEPLVFSQNKTENLDFKYNYIVHLIVKLKYLSIKIVRWTVTSSNNYLCLLLTSIYMRNILSPYRSRLI